MDELTDSIDSIETTEDFQTVVDEFANHVASHAAVSDGRGDRLADFVNMVQSATDRRTVNGTVEQLEGAYRYLKASDGLSHETSRLESKWQQHLDSLLIQGRAVRSRQ